MTTPLPPAVNFHLWRPCNMRCQFCFATFQDIDRVVLPKGHLHREAALEVTRLLAAQFDKVNFAGGEPTICPWLPELMDLTHQAGCTTTIVTNGSRLDDAYLDRIAPSVDWVGISIDSPNPITHARTGRATRSGPMAPETYVAIAERLRDRGIRLKVNTVVHQENVDEDMTAFIEALRPERWKVFQVLPVGGQNDGRVERLLISDEQFDRFLERHQGVTANGIDLVPEDNDAMTGSYAMVDPAGRFFDNTEGEHTYSRPLLQVGIDAAWREISFDSDQFVERGGVYQW